MALFDYGRNGTHPFARDNNISGIIDIRELEHSRGDAKPHGRSHIDTDVPSRVGVDLAVEPQLDKCPKILAKCLHARQPVSNGYY